MLRRCLVTLEPEAWPSLIPDIQLAINSTYSKSIGCPPFLVMFGSLPTTQQFNHVPDPTQTSVTHYTIALRRQLANIQAASQAAHAAYRARAATEDTLP